MLGISLLDNPIRHYDWGSRTAIAELQGRSFPTDQPEAELWMGAHPAQPSRVRYDGRDVALSDLLREVGEEALGSEVSSRFGNELPFLFKVLAAGEPLSIQAHPNRKQAVEGFERESRAKIPIDAPHRNYRDRQPKPELICALTPFWALRGFRTATAIASGFRAHGVDEFAAEVDALERDGNGVGHRSFFAAMMGADASRVKSATSQVTTQTDGSGTAYWLGELVRRYPEDIGALAPLLLNLVRLEPGEAMYLGAGELHSYLKGVGVEIMANSDNVLRGGLTPKHVDVPELMHTLTFESGDPTVLRPEPKPTGERIFETPASQFELAKLTLEHARSWSSGTGRGPEIWLAAEGDFEFRAATGNLRVARGQSAFAPDCVERYEIVGAGTLFRAAVPRSRDEG